ncbi:MAG: Holliday junction resolvase RuvX [Saprospiraceae bacterium]
MPRILGIDFGLKRCGIAVTDPLQIIVSGLETIETPKLLSFLEFYLELEKVEKIVFGYPTHKDGNDTYVVEHIKQLTSKCQQQWPEILIDYQNEQFSSHMARQIILQSGVNRKKRQDKALVDKVSAIVILQKYLKHI